MLREIDNLIIEIASDKVQVRGKAFTKLNQILNSRLKELQHEIDSVTEDDSDISWEKIFKAAHRGILAQCEQLSKKSEAPPETDTKIANYSNAILKICDSPSNESSIAYDLMMKSVLEVLQTDILVKYFGKCYFQLLQKFILKPKNNLTLISREQWKDILYALFDLFKRRQTSMSTVEIAFCTKQVVDIGCSFSQLSTSIAQYLPQLTVLLEKRTQEREKLELLTLAYSCCRNIAAEFRFEVCRFTESIAKHIHYVFKVELDENVKEILFKLMDLSIIVHYPKLADGRGDLEHVQDKDDWYKGLRNYSHIVGLEMKQQSKSKYRGIKKEDVSQVLLQFAARFSYLMHWDESFWAEIEVEGENATKRARLPEKLQSLIEFAHPSATDFNWKWIAIIAEVISNFSAALTNEDFQPLLQLLSECQASIEHDYQIYAFTKCCAVLLDRDETFTKNTNVLVVNLCSEFWHKIADGALRVCTSNNKPLLKNHALLQILIHHHKYPSNSFIEDLIKIFLTKSTAKVDATLQTLVTLLTSVNLDLLHNGKELTKKLLTYTLEKTTLADFKQIIAASGSDKPSPSVLGRIGAICCLSKTDVVNFSKRQKLDIEALFDSNWNLEQQKSYITETSEITQLILLKCYNRLLIDCDDFHMLRSKTFIDPRKSQFPVEIKCILDNDVFEDVLFKVTEFKTKVVDDSNNIEDIKEYLKQVLDNNVLMMNLADNFFSFEAFNEEKFTGSFIAKKIDFHMQEIERLFELILQKSSRLDKLDLKDTHQLLQLVKSLFSSRFHDKIGCQVRSHQLTNCLRWVAKQVKHEFHEYDEDAEPMKFGWNEFANAKMDELLKFHAIDTLCQYNNLEGLDTDYMCDRLERVELEVTDNIDLHTIFHVLKLLGGQRFVPQRVISWIWLHIIPICGQHYLNQYVSSRLIEIFNEIVHLSKNEPDQTSNVIVLFSSYAKLLAKPFYNPALLVQYIYQFQFFHHDYVKLSADEDEVIEIYDFIVHDCLESDVFSVKIAAIKCISFILTSDIEKDEAVETCDLKKKVFEKILDSHSIKYAQDDMETDKEIDDVELGKVSTHVQLFTSIFCANFVMRKPVIFELAKLSLRFKLSNETSLQIFSKILKFLKCDAGSLFDSNSIHHFLFQWYNNYGLINIPWYFTGSSSLEDFVQVNYDLMALSILKKRPSAIEEFSQTIEMAPKQIVDEIMPNCFAYFLPVEAGCQGIKYEDSAEAMKKKVDSIIPIREQETIMLRKTAAVIGRVLENVFDKKKFLEIGGFRLEVNREVEMLDCASFNKCLNHLKRYFSMPADSSILTFFCDKRGNFIEQLLMAQKKKIQNTSLKEHKVLFFLQYCVLVEKLYDYLNDSTVSSNTSIKGFIVKEIVYFICFLLLDEAFGMRLRQTVANFFSGFLEKILPACADDVKPLLNKILSSLITICKKMKTPERSSFEVKCFKIIKFLLADRDGLLEDEIASLDMLPDTEEFAELRKHQLAVKYKNGAFSLEEEIELFLKVKKRKVEGLIAIREQLALKKTELKTLYNQLSETLGFSEDGENSLLHKLLRSLVDYARNSADDEERAVEAVKCLGEIGNYDVATMVFITEAHQKSTTYKDMESVVKCQKTICHTALDQLEMMVLHQNARIFESASKACYRLLESASSNDYEISIYLRPFNTNTENPAGIFYEALNKSKKLNLMQTLKSEEYSTYKTWIKRLVGSMLIFLGDKTLEPVSSAQKSFAETLNPMMFQLLLMYDDPSLNKEIIDGIDFFFNEAAVKINHPKANEGSNFLNKLAIKQMLMLVECLRIHCQDHRKSDMANQLNLNYLHIAKASKHCEAFFTAVLYCEKWAEKRLNEKVATYQTSMGDKTLQEVMYEAFTAIGIHDASSLFVNPMTLRPLYLQNCNRNWQNIIECDAVFDENQTEHCIKLLNEMGLHSLTYKLAASSNDQKLKSNQYECLWRMSNWDVVVEGEPEAKDIKTVIDNREEFEKFHYASLKCLKTGDELGAKTAIFKARKSILYLLQQESLECTKNLYKFLGMSHLLQQVEDFGVLRFKKVANSHEELLRKWNTQNEFPNSYDLIEPILTQRNSVLDTADIRTGKRAWVPQALQSNMLLIVKESIEAGKKNDAIRVTAKMRASPSLTTNSKGELLIHEARLNLESNINLAKHCLKRVMEDKEFENQFLLQSIAYRLYGEILAENHADDIEKIETGYFHKSIQHLRVFAKQQKKSHLVVEVNYTDLSEEMSQSSQESSDDVDKAIKENCCVYDIVAKYFDREYVSRCEYIDSPDFVKKLKAIEKNKEKMKGFSDLVKQNRSNKDLLKSFTILKRSLEIDEAEVQEVYNQRKVAAKKAMYYYLNGAVNDTSDNIIGIFRIISIWMANPNHDVIWKMLNKSLLKIPSYNFVVALPQLVVRLTDNADDKANRLLMDLLGKCAIEHPHQTLPLILALVNSYADDTSKCSQEEPRVSGAKKLWDSLSKSPKISSLMLKQMQEMATGLIKLANCQSDTIPTNHKFYSLKNLNLVQCPTVEIPLMKDGNYSRAVTSVLRWSKQLDYCGGINAPKKIYCYCSDGVKRTQLLKGFDDMRQDAVMQQVFAVVNRLLADNKETRKRHARVRTYKVVPLARRSGILEWCENTTTIGNYLTTKDKKGAHERYHPDDWAPMDCLRKLLEVDKASQEKKEKVYIQICNNIRPVFHQFFYENFKEPGQWFERRLAYTTSVAVSSMVGYILGIGDRHVQNILIDYKTAEVIHIDFGIAFEQGRVLPHPELIPFRLTRDIIAPMGVCGVDGVFRKTCEKTMELLRENYKTLTTILEVLLYDPMYSWTLSTSQAQRYQLGDSEDINVDPNEDARESGDSMASRALLRIQAKLKGQADDSTGYSSVEGQVECLINKATNTSLLARLFKGWQAYL